MLEQDGFAIVADAGLAGVVARVSRTLDSPSLAHTRAGARHLLRHEHVAVLANDPALLEMAHRAVGPGAIAFRATLFDKSPVANWLVTWHQDTALPLRARHALPGWGPWSEKEGILYAHAPAAALQQVVAIRVHLDDSAMQNGPLRVLPGTHTRGVLNQDALAELVTRVPPVECLVPRGGLVVMRPLLVHASSKATMALRRRVIHFEYAASVELVDGVELAIV